jgi:hypothetical protein
MYQKETYNNIDVDTSHGASAESLQRARYIRGNIISIRYLELVEVRLRHPIPREHDHKYLLSLWTRS